MHKKTIKLTTINGKQINLIVRDSSMVVVGNLETGESFAFDTPTDAMVMREQCEKFVQNSTQAIKPPKDYPVWPTAVEWQAEPSWTDDKDAVKLSVTNDS